MATDMDRFIATADKWSGWSRGLERLRPNEYIPEQQSFTRPPGASVRRVGGKWVVRERTPSLKPAQEPRRTYVGSPMPSTIGPALEGRLGEGSMVCDVETLLRRTYGPAACNDGMGRL